MYANDTKGSKPFNEYDKSIVKDKQARLTYHSRKIEIHP
jgi:ubiquitin